MRDFNEEFLFAVTGIRNFQDSLKVEKAFETLRLREKRVLELRFGLTGNGFHSLPQIGILMRISKERVRQVQNRGLEKLRIEMEKQSI